MIYTVKNGKISGNVRPPASKSQSIRALVLALLAEGESRIDNILISDDVSSCISCCRELGAEIEISNGTAIVRGTGGRLHSDVVLDAANSGTSLYFLTAVAALAGGRVDFDGDASLRKRSAGELLRALRELGANCRGEYLPYTVIGPIRGGRVAITCPTSQYLSALLLVLPLVDQVSEIEVLQLNEAPYVGMTLKWLEAQGCKLSYRDDYTFFRIEPSGPYQSFQTKIAADASSSTFWFCAAALSGGELGCLGIDPNDGQGDIAVLDILATMGARVDRQVDRVNLRGAVLSGGSFDLNSMPDSLPALMACSCYAREPVRFTNIAHARLKESDRIEVMSKELSKMGAHIETTEDSITIHPGQALQGTDVDSHDDHRIAMALSIAALGADGETHIHNSECVSVTYPNFYRDLEKLSS